MYVTFRKNIVTEMVDESGVAELVTQTSLDICP